MRPRKQPGDRPIAELISGVDAKFSLTEAWTSSLPMKATTSGEVVAQRQRKPSAVRQLMAKQPAENNITSTVDRLRTSRRVLNIAHTGQTKISLTDRC